MIKSHVIKLYPTKAQAISLQKACDVRRNSWNWGLAMWKELYDKKEKINAMTLIKLQNSIKRSELPWFLEVTKCAPQYARGTVKDEITILNNQINLL